MASRKKNPETLTQAAAQLLSKVLLPDLAARAEQPSIRRALGRQHAAEKNAGRTAESAAEWQARTLEQVGAAWILSCVFVRTLEDRGLLARRRVAGGDAADSEQLFFELAPSLTARDYLLTVFEEVSSLPGAEDVLGRAHNPAWRLSPSNDAARALLDFFRTRDAQGELRWRFEGEDTRFLGDLYQDLSEAVRKRYALLQTPDFVESFILDHTLEPAIQTFGLSEVRVIDPTCGSGHFLLGAFERLVDHRLRSAPGTDVRTHAEAALGQIYGVDVNPFAVAIARFRLTLAYLTKAGFTQIAQAPKLALNLVVADSLLHGAKDTNLRLTEQAGVAVDEAAFGDELFALDDPIEARRIFAQRYHAVVGNPPYVTCKDAKLRDRYREAYVSAAGKYALAAPFTERFFQLSFDGGYVGLINANSFMKREFGKPLIEKVLADLDLTRVIDSAGAYIPGHGTPTVLLFGRNQKAVGDTVRAVLGKRGEPSTPDDPEQGLVWRSIVEHIDEVGFENEYVSVADVARTTFGVHPWSLGGGGAAELKELLESRAEKTLGELAEDIGFASFTGLDDAFIIPSSVAHTQGLEPDVIRPMVVGEDVRDWCISAGDVAVTPYDNATQIALPLQPHAKWARSLWRYRTAAKNVASFGGKTRDEEGQNWWEWYRWQTTRYAAPFRIAFAFVATHNHFVLDRGGKVFNRTAPIIKLPDDATEDDHLALLAYLNSSTACFWMKQVFFEKSSQNYVGDVRDKPERIHYEFASTGLARLPLPPSDPRLVEYGRRLSALADERASNAAANVLRHEFATLDELDNAFRQASEAEEALLHRMVAAQEELDWLVYSLFGLVEPAAVRADAADVTFGAAADQRPFLRPPPESLPDGLWRTRADLLARGHAITAFEQPLHKRPWLGTQGVFHRDAWSYAERAHSAVRDMLCEGLERLIAGDVRPVNMRVLRGRVERSPSLRTAAEYLARALGKDLDAIIVSLVTAEGVACASAVTLTASGKRKLAAWQSTWLLQRREDLGETVNDIPVPPKYDSKDYAAPEYWRLRGKLDVPKERFISYPGCEKDSDPSPLIGWAGWNHLQRAQALIALYQERKLEDGWDTKRLMPMLVGLHELMFWLELWHSEPEAGSQNPAREFQGFLDAELAAHKLTTDDLEAWRPEKTKVGRRAKKTPKRDAGD